MLSGIVMFVATTANRVFAKPKKSIDPWWRRTQTYQGGQEFQETVERRDKLIREYTSRQQLGRLVKKQNPVEKRMSITKESLRDCDFYNSQTGKVSKRKCLEMLKKSLKNGADTGFYDNHSLLTGIIANMNGTYHIESLKGLGLWDTELEQIWQNKVINPRREDKTIIDELGSEGKLERYIEPKPELIYN